MPSLGAEVDNAGGHNLIARTSRTVDVALRHVRDRLNVLLGNIAPLATASASSSLCPASGLDCFSPSRINDTDLDTRVGSNFSWANGIDSPSEWVQLTWPELINTDYLEVFTSEGLPIRDYVIEYLDGSTWRRLLEVSENERVHIRHNFNNIQTTAIRLRKLKGSTAEPSIARVNEIIVVGDWVNIPPVARCTASPKSGFDRFQSTLSGADSFDPDGDNDKITFSWELDGVPINTDPTDRQFTRTFVNNPFDNSKIKIFSAKLTVKDELGAQSDATCTVTVISTCPDPDNPDSPSCPKSPRPR
ncbi:MAG: hypothetical protein F6K10_03980 [Moorea sp. SIO2B7]|nr:hypothetical protein [Moorena sp. SIO2B7]